MKNKLTDKIEEIATYLEQLETIKPSSLEEYQKNFEKKAACERYFEKIVEAVVDLAFLTLKDKNIKIPEEDKEAFDLFAEKRIMTEELAAKLKDAKGMRNILSHQYGDVNDALVFESVAEELVDDVESFLVQLERYEQTKLPYRNNKP